MFGISPGPRFTVWMFRNRILVWNKEMLYRHCFSTLL